MQPYNVAGLISFRNGRGRTAAAHRLAKCDFSRSSAKRFPYGDLDRRIGAIRSFQTKRRRGRERRLRHESRSLAAIFLRGMDEEWVAEIDRPRFARRQSHFPLRADFSQLKVRHSRFPGRGQKTRHVEMRTDADARRRIFLADIREQKQHQQRSVA